MLRLAKLAPPLTAGPVVVPASVPPLGFVPRATATEPANPVATLPPASSAVTCTAGVMAAPAAVLVGCPVKTNWGPPPPLRWRDHLSAPGAPLPAAPAGRPPPTCRTSRRRRSPTPPPPSPAAVPPTG